MVSRAKLYFGYSPLFRWYGNRVLSRVRSATRQAALDTAWSIRGRAHEFTYAFWNYQTGAAGQTWDVREDSTRAVRDPRTGQVAAYSVQVGAYAELGTNRPGGAPYIVWLEEGWTDRAGQWHEGGHMLARALAEARQDLVLPLAIQRAWRSSV